MRDKEYFINMIYGIEDYVDRLEIELGKTLGNELRSIEHRFLDLSLTLTRISEFVERELD